MNYSNSINQILGETDIYLADQIIKGRYQINDKILDAGCGTGRNLHWFLQNNISIYGIDTNEDVISNLKTKFPLLPAERFQQSSIEKIPFENNYFDHVISSAVLHFADTTFQFYFMMAEMIRVLKPKGSLFIRMTSDIGIENKVELISNGVYNIPDGSKRFLLTRPILADLIQKYKLSFLEPLKTVNVDDIRCMTTLLLQKSLLPL